MTEVAEACDILGVNIYPFYVDSLETIDDNLVKLQSMYDNIYNNFPNANIWITETGFPSGGSDCSSEQETSVERTQEYFEGIKDWAENNQEVPVYYFQYFDKETEENQEDICNNFFGICDAEGIAKFDF